jgi:hypothetical protein
VDETLMLTARGNVGWDRAAFAIVALFLLSPRPSHSQQSTQPNYIGRIVGVYDDRSGNPLDSVEIRDMLTGSFSYTTSTGTLSLFFVDTAGSLLRIRKFGYKPITLFVGNTPGLPPLTVTLEPLAQKLPAVVTRDTVRQYIGPMLRGFEHRRRSGMGYFVPDSLLRKEESRPLANVLRAHVPTLEIAEINIKGQRLTIAASHRTQAASLCQVDVYLDGVPLTSNRNGGTLAILGARRSGATATEQGYVDLSQFLVSDLGGVEFHNTSDMPAEFAHTGSGCGALYLWTREK